jgi:hypothetical protein
MVGDKREVQIICYGVSYLQRAGMQRVLEGGI